NSRAKITPSTTYRTHTSFPTRRSSDLVRMRRAPLQPMGRRGGAAARRAGSAGRGLAANRQRAGGPGPRGRRDPSTGPHDPVLLEDRKSTRLNSSHVKISYAVFCLKKKK